MQNQLEIERSLGIVLWHVMVQRGDGNVYKGRATLVNGTPTEEEWLEGLRYVMRVEPRSTIAKASPESILRWTQEYYAEGAVGACLDAYWYDQGMPTIEVGHKLASSLMLSRIPREVMETAKMPFRAFRINVPSGLLNFDAGDVKTIKVGDHVVPAKEPPHEPRMGTAFVVRSETGGSYTIASDLPGLLYSDFSEPAWAPYGSEQPLPLTEDELKKLPLITNLIAGVCLYMTGDEKQFPRKQTGSGHKAWNGDRREPGSAPLTRVFRLTKEVTHNFSDAVKDYCAGKGRKMTVQYVVTGHWRNQACGPKLSERRRQFIEPFWKGDRLAPLAVRAHKLEE
jgi:hypothetical protein